MTKKETHKPTYNMWQNTAYMIRLAWTHAKSVLFHIPLLVFLAITQNLAELFIVPVILENIEAQIPLLDLTLLILGFALLLVLTTGLETYTNYLVECPRIEIRSNISSMIHYKKRTMSYPYIESSKAEKMYDGAQNCTHSNWAAAEAIWTTLTELLKAVIGFLIYVILLCNVNPVLIVIICICSVISFFASKYFNEWDYRHKEEKAEYSKECSYVSQKSQNRRLAKDLRIFGMQPWLNDLHTKSLQLIYAFTAKQSQQEVIGKAIVLFLTFLQNGIAYSFLLSQVLYADMSAAEFLLYFTAIGNFTNWTAAILTQVAALHKHSLDLCRLREFLELPEPFLFEAGKPLQPDTAINYEIQLKNVSFVYPESEQYIFRHINLTIRAGEKLAIVGLNGAGKTTLVKLICGFYDPTEGEVLLNGVNIKEYDRRDYYKHFSAVFQQFSILDAPIEVNIAQSVSDIDTKRVHTVLKQAGLQDKISALPKGIKSPVGRFIYKDGVEFSGGETQRLMLARALYKDAPILILDEPTAALDPIAENDIYLKYNEMTTARTSIFISHRLASTRFCDRIIFLADGIIQEEGTHADLMELGGKYAGLFQVQSKYYQDASENYKEGEHSHETAFA